MFRSSPGGYRRARRNARRQGCSVSRLVQALCLCLVGGVLGTMLSLTFMQPQVIERRPAEVSLQRIEADQIRHRRELARGGPSKGTEFGTTLPHHERHFQGAEEELHRNSAEEMNVELGTEDEKVERGKQGVQEERTGETQVKEGGALRSRRLEQLGVGGEEVEREPPDNHFKRRKNGGGDDSERLAEGDERGEGDSQGARKRMREAVRAATEGAEVRHVKSKEPKMDVDHTMRSKVETGMGDGVNKGGREESVKARSARQEEFLAEREADKMEKTSKLQGRKVSSAGIFGKPSVKEPGNQRKSKPIEGLEYQLGADRIQELLSTEVPVTLSQKALENEDFAFTCGGKLIVEFNTMRQVAAADSRLRATLPEDDLMGPTGRRGAVDSPLKSCAVVGNSGDLLDHRYGPQIDSFDTVIRFNAAPTWGYEEHVGRKTTIRILNIDLLHWPKARGMIAMYTVRSKKDIKKYLKYQEARDLRPVYLFHPEWWCHVWQWLGHKKVKPSTGFAGVVLALHLCSSVHLFGFSHNASRFHYFNVLPDKVTKHDVYNFHPLIEESSLYRELESQGRLVMLS